MRVKHQSHELVSYKMLSLHALYCMKTLILKGLFFDKIFHMHTNVTLQYSVFMLDKIKKNLAVTCVASSFSFLVKLSSAVVVSFLAESSEAVAVVPVVVEVSVTSVTSSNALSSSSSGVLVSTTPLTILMSASQCF